MELTAAIGILASALAPAFIALIVQPSWPAAQKRNVALAVSALLGVIVAVASGRIVGIPESVVAWTGQVIIAVGIVVSLSQGYYAALKGPLDALSVATSPRRAMPED